MARTAGYPRREGAESMKQFDDVNQNYKEGFLQTTEIFFIATWLR